MSRLVLFFGSADHVADVRQAALRFLNGYTADFFGAAVSRWDELERHLWRQTWTGF